MKKVGELKVKQLLKKKYPKVSVDDSIKKVLNKFYTQKVNVLPVFSRKKIVGEIYKIDVLKLVVNMEKIPVEEILEFGYSIDWGYFAKKAKDIMSHHTIFVNENELVEDVAWRMLQNNIRSVPVVDLKGKLIGLITVDEIIKRILKRGRKL